MRPWCLFPLVALLAVGCSRPDADAPALQPGDVLRPELAFAPEAPWPADAEVTVGLLVRVERPGGTTRYLMDKDLDLERAVAGGRVTFFHGEQVIGEPHELPFVHDCWGDGRFLASVEAKLIVPAGATRARVEGRFSYPTPGVTFEATAVDVTINPVAAK